MNAGEYGVAFRLAVGYDISGFSSLSLVFHKPSGATLTVDDDDGVSAPATAATGTLPTGQPYTYDANEYFQYTTADGDIDEEGKWTVCGIYVDGEKRLVSQPVHFHVGKGCDAS